MSGLRSLFNSLLVVLCFVGFFVGGALLSWLILPLARRRTDTPLQQARASQRRIRRAFAFFHCVLNRLQLLRHTPSGAQIELPAEPCVIIANHPTLVDVTAILAAIDNTACVVKPALFQSPAVGRLLVAAWHIRGGQGTPTAAAQVLSEAEQRLRAGMHVLIFPEGTRSPAGGIGPFQRGAFELAQRAGVRIVPLLMRASRPFLTKERPWYAGPPPDMELTITRLPTLDPQRWKGDSRAAAKATQLLYQQELGLAPKA